MSLLSLVGREGRQSLDPYWLIPEASRRIMAVVDNPCNPRPSVPLKFRLLVASGFVAGNQVFQLTMLQVPFSSLAHCSFEVSSLRVWTWFPDLLPTWTQLSLLLTLGATRWSQPTAAQSPDCYWPPFKVDTNELPSAGRCLNPNNSPATTVLNISCSLPLVSVSPGACWNPQ